MGREGHRSGPSPPTAWRAFLVAHARITRALDVELRNDKDLPISWYDALLQLHEAGGSLRMADLADRLLLSRSATSRFADRLEREGLVNRSAVEEDRRGMRLELTSSGRHRLSDAAHLHLDGIHRHFTSHLDRNELELLARIMERLAGEDQS